MQKIEQYRFFLKDTIRKAIDFRTTDQHRGVAPPPLEHPVDPGLERIELPPIDKWRQFAAKTDILTAMAGRQSRRRFTAASLALEELAFLLWATQGVRHPDGRNPVYRTVPSAGARHSFETYLFVMRVDGLQRGLYRYLPVTNALVFSGDIDLLEERLSHACLGQRFVAQGAVTFVWTTVPYRMEWRYAQAAHRVILLDAGHVCQNLYLACEAIHAGTCAIAAYDQEALDALIGVDGADQFALYLAPVGKR